MPGQAPRRGDAQVAFERSVQLLACEFTVRLPCERTARWLEEAIPHARQEFPVSWRHRLEIAREVDGYRVCENGTRFDLESSPDAAGERLLARMHELAMAALADYTKIHAGYAALGTRRLLAAGPGRSGKTTLMTTLLYEGLEVHGDEMVLIRDGVAVAYPRRFGIRQPTLSLVPQVEALAPKGSRAPNSHGYQVFAFDPGVAGLPWRIAPGPVDVIVFLDPLRGERSRLHDCPKHLMAQRLMTQSTPPGSGRRRWIEDVRDIVQQARCYVLDFGELTSAVSAIRGTLHEAGVPG